VSNQWLPPLNGVVGTLGLAPDLTTYAGSQFAEWNPASAAGDGGTAGGLHATASNAEGLAVIAFRLPSDAVVDLTVMDVRGRLLTRLLADASLAAGEHAVRWDGRDGEGRTVASGVYLFRLSAGGERAQGRIVVVR
jgi:hypothetical protein